jgi:hypothetical protein
MVIERIPSAAKQMAVERIPSAKWGGRSVAEVFHSRPPVDQVVIERIPSAERNELNE